LASTDRETSVVRPCHLSPFDYPHEPYGHPLEAITIGGGRGGCCHGSVFTSEAQQIGNREFGERRAILIVTRHPDLAGTFGNEIEVLNDVRHYALRAGCLWRRLREAMAGRVGQGHMEPIREAIRRLSRFGYAAKERALPAWKVAQLQIRARAAMVVAMVEAPTAARRADHHWLRAAVAEAGASVFKLAEVSRRKSLDTLRGYVRRVDLFREHAGAAFL
jgi:hypothetical protein